MSDEIRDYTHHPEFGLEWEKWLSTLEGKEYRYEVEKGYTLDIAFHKIRMIRGVIQCLSAMLARRDKRIKELLNEITDTQQNFP